MRTTAIVVLLLVGCGTSASTPPPGAPPAPDPAAPTRPDERAAPSVDAIRARSGCTFGSLAEMCAGLRDFFASSGTGWVSDDCALGEPRGSSGPFAELREIGIRHGYDAVQGDARVAHPVLAGTVHEPPGHEATTELVLAARVGSLWFPIHIWHPMVEGEIPGHRVSWELDASGATLTWTDEENPSMRDQPGAYGRVERTIAVIDRGAPIIAAQAEIERWRGEVDLECTRACNEDPSPPPYPGCERRCATRFTVTRSWERDANEVRIGASELRREGRESTAAAGIPMAEAETRRLDAADPRMLFCAFTPIERAIVPAAAPSDPASVAARERAREIVRAGTFREVPGAREAAVPDAPRATIEIHQRGGTACGGGGCTVDLRFRTIDGPMPERGVEYFADQRGPRTACDDAVLSGAGATIVEVAPAISRDAIGCGFSGWDGATRRYWVVVRVLDVAR